VSDLIVKPTYSLLNFLERQFEGIDLLHKAHTLRRPCRAQVARLLLFYQKRQPLLMKLDRRFSRFDYPRVDAFYDVQPHLLSCRAGLM
jgi:hypothetical protein